MPPLTMPAASHEPFAVRGSLVLPSDRVPGTLVVEGGRIVALTLGAAPADLPSIVYEAAVVSPGFIDLQVNGGFGVEVSDRPADIRHMAAHLPSTGVTAFLPTLVSSAPEAYPRAARAFEESRHAAGAEPLGFHLEGPFLSLRHAGAHRPAAIEAAHPGVYDLFLEYDSLRLVTLAPEVAGARALIDRLRAHGVVVSLGHTGASYEQLRDGIEAGATMVTHLYNAMSSFHHRVPGAVGAALDDPRVTVGLIADGVHCHPASIRLAVNAKGPVGVALVTDAVSGAGMEPGSYQLDGQDIQVDAAARLPDGTLAGSVLTMDQAVRNVTAWTGRDVAEVCRMASEVPARLLGLSTKGRLVVGADADLVLMDEGLRVVATFRNGVCLFRQDVPKGVSD